MCKCFLTFAIRAYLFLVFIIWFSPVCFRKFVLKFLLSGLNRLMRKCFFYLVVVGYLLLMFRILIEKTVLIDFCLVRCDSLTINFSFIIDEVSLMFVGVVMIISGRVGIYSSWYIDDEKFFFRFIFLILLFVGCMIILILIPNLVCLILGWDGLGLVSFLLVCYYQNRKRLGAAIITALSNRVGDVMILICIGIMGIYGDWILYKRYDVGFSLVMSIIFILAGTTKRAQIPFSAWLPAAIAAPTPVSSLVHSSTLVTAGVYLLIRGFNFLEANPLRLEILKLASLLTLFIAGIVALIEVDFKKVIALSTLRQLGVIMFCLSIKLPYVAFFHLITHATFKALLFVRAGCVIHSNLGNQDLRSLSKCWEELPVRIRFLSVASLSLAGVPFIRGFFSKDLIIELILIQSDTLIFYFIIIVGVSFTSWYIARVFFSVILGCNKRITSITWSKERATLVVSYICLFFCAVFSGWLISIKFKLVIFSNFIDRFLFILVCLIPIYGVSTLLFRLRLIPLPWAPLFIKFIISMWNLKSLSSQYLIIPRLSFCYNASRCLDQGWLEAVGPQGSYFFLSAIRQKNQKIQRWYFLLLLRSLMICITLLLIIVVLYCFMR